MSKAPKLITSLALKWLSFVKTLPRILFFMFSQQIHFLSAVHFCPLPTCTIIHNNNTGTKNISQCWKRRRESNHDLNFTHINFTSSSSSSSSCSSSSAVSPQHLLTCFTPAHDFLHLVIKVKVSSYTTSHTCPKHDNSIKLGQLGFAVTCATENVICCAKQIFSCCQQQFVCGYSAHLGMVIQPEYGVCGGCCSLNKHWMSPHVCLQCLSAENIGCGKKSCVFPWRNSP